MTEEKIEQGRAVARTVSFTEKEWLDLQKLAGRWKTSRSGALRRIWLEWEQCEATRPVVPDAGQDGDS